jgi:hypothetical protein
MSVRKGSGGLVKPRRSNEKAPSHDDQGAVKDGVIVIKGIRGVLGEKVVQSCNNAMKLT